MTIRVLAPAKLNLGLEITGRRPDGYHDLQTVFCAVSLFDRVTIGLPGAFGPLDDADLAERARLAIAKANPGMPPVSIGVDKRIPVAAGLGGGSSDAAAVLRSMAGNLAPRELRQMALGLGSDVPFLLEGGLAVGSGRGEMLDSLPFRSLAFLLITFDLQLRDKTRSMFAALEPGDFSDGSEIEQIAWLVRDHPEALVGLLMRNGFRRALYHLLPMVAEVAQEIEQRLGLPVLVTGAGPTLFVVASDLEHALRLRADIRSIDSINGRFDRCICVRSVGRVPIVGSIA
jgi:4-diphosphocytidyl-2-C-methyl-D-erythritol kinase